MNEHHIEAQLKKAVEASGGLCWKLVCPGTTGVPDRLCLMGGQVVFVEVKAPRQEASADPTPPDEPTGRPRLHRAGR